MGFVDTESNTRYLQNYAEEEARLPTLSHIKSVDAVLVIPAYKEPPEFLLELLSQDFIGVTKLLLILVSNHPADIAQTNINSAVECHKNLRSCLPAPSWQEDLLSYYDNDKLSVLIVDKTGKRALDAKQGVGLARKIGADIALALFSRHKIEIPWIFNTDADAHLPRDYFSSVSSAENDVAATIYPYKYEGSSDVTMNATKLYEMRLDRYVSGLKSARSPYAFQTLGSTIAVTPNAYANVRGFPKRAAGEDFYLLNKLAKVGGIESLSKPEIKLQSRCSDRIPFGTGPAVSALLNSPDLLAENFFYHPEIFAHLKLFIATMTASCEREKLTELPAAIQLAANSLGIKVFLKHAETQKLVNDQYRHHFHLWFDAFKTLKFVHYLRDNYFENISYRELAPSEQSLLL